MEGVCTPPPNETNCRSGDIWFYYWFITGLLLLETPSSAPVPANALKYLLGVPGAAMHPCGIG